MKKILLLMLFVTFGCQQLQAQCPAGITWISRTSATNNYWRSVTYGNGIFVAVADSGTGNRVMTSPDGINWTSRTAAADNLWNDVTYGNGLFVAVAYSGTGNRVMTSPDGITWTSRSPAANNQWFSVTYGNGLFVAVSIDGIGNRVMTSPDGINWTSRTTTTYDNWASVTYGNGLFVAVAFSGTGNRVMTSPDGINWTNRTSATNNIWFSVTYGNGLFVAVSIDGIGNRVMTSPDGVTWTSRTSAADNNWASVTYGNGLFVAVAFSGTGNRVMTSPDGITWTSRTSASSNSWYAITYGNGLFVAVAGSGIGNRVMTSSPAFVTPSLTIAASPGNSVATGTAVTFTATPTNGGTTPAYQWKKNGNNVGSDSVTYTDAFLENGDIITCVLTSNDPCASPTTASSAAITMAVSFPCPAGTTWTSRTAATANFWTSITYGNGLFVAVAQTGTGNRVMTSPDGINWTSQTSAADNLWNDVTYGNGIFVAVAYSGTGNRVMTSPDGIIWTTQTSAADNNWFSITYGNGLFVAVAGSGNGNRVMTSPDGISWTIRTSAGDNNWNSVTYGNGLFVAVAFSGTGNRVMTSPDGITWTDRTSATNNNWYSVTYGNGLFVAVASSGTGNRVMTSPDGVTWTSRTSAADYNWTSITYGNGLFVAVGSTGNRNRVMTSPDGITWTSRTAASSNSWYALTYGNGLFVAVSGAGSGDRVMTSSPAFVTPSLTIAASPGNSVATGTAVTFTATPTNGGASPGYSWRKNGNEVLIDSVTYTDAALANGDIITCVLSSNDPCALSADATSNGIIMAVGAPTVTATSELSAFVSCSDATSVAQSFTVSGANLAANIILTPPTGFELSITSGSGFASNVTLTPSGGSVSATTIYVRLTASAFGTPSGNITCTSTGAIAQNVAVSATVNPNITPTFTAVDPICSGESLSALTTTSNNGIIGTWSPALNNAATTTYTFTPSVGQCANIATLSITVKPLVTPTFRSVEAICPGATLSALPTTSNDEIIGTWSPPLNNTNTTTYKFTPDAGQCANTTTMTIMVNGNVIPEFTAVNSICTGESLADLPTASNDGIIGTWSPPLNNTNTTIYKFTPDAGQCANTTTMTIKVNPNVTPEFTGVKLICAGESLSALPTTSNVGITGTWLPALDNTATTTYTFTPTAGQCALTTTLTIYVNPNVTPTFTKVAPICSGETLLPLPTTSTNGIIGTWFPALNNLETNIYTFTPNAGQCATTASLTITVQPSVQPTFTAVAPICYGDSLADLPTTSLEGITGTWSPAINKLATTTYTFTPDAGQCATVAVTTIIVHQTNPPYTVAQSLCSGATIESLYSIGTDVSWYTVPTGGTALIAGTYLVTGNYYASQTLNGCESDRITTTITINPNVMPSFNQVAAICVGDTLAPLPTTSNNGITGTWSPALNNLATTTYEFTVDAGQCSEKGIMTITVNPSVTPTFNQVAAICAGDSLVALPTKSNEGIAGTWSPALNNLATTTYVFTPNVGQCATTTSMTITVNPIVIPTFTQVAPICTGGFLANLPTTSINGVNGGWFPAINNLATTTYTFTPKKEQQCATTATMTVTVNPNVTPLFTQIAPIFCSGATLAPLPTTSINGVNGSWSPVMNNLATTTYTFTPNAGQCASTVTMTIVVQTVGTITGGNITVCAPGTALDLNGVATVFINNTTLTFNGNPAGSTIQWQRSFNYINATNATPSWSAVANTTTANNNVLINGNTLTISNLTSTIWYRVRVTNGSCFTYTVPVKVGVTPLARAGAITSLSSVCAGGNITFTSAAYTGSAIAWEVSTTSATAGFSIVAGANGLSFTMLNAPSTRFYVRAIVTSGACSMARSAVRTITVSPRSVGGTIIGGGTVCSGANKMLRITGSTGSIQWMYSTDAINFVNVPNAPAVAPTFSTTSISGTASTYVVNNITGLTYFKAVVRSGVCFSKESNTVKYVGATAATAGTATAAASSICPNTATTIDLVGCAGDIAWQRSINPTAANPTWVTIAGAVSATLNTGNLTVTTAYRARVTIGSCAPIVTSNVVLVSINCTTGSKQIDAPTEIAEPFSVVAYPNPSNNVFNFKINGSNNETVSVLVFDMMGRQIENKVVNATDIENISLGQNYSTGIYNVIVSQGMNTKTVRLVKN